MFVPDPRSDTAVPKVYRPWVGGALGRVGVGVASFVLVLLALRAVAAPAGGSVIGGKLEYWRQHGSEYDTVFLGSSHVFRAFVPPEFDRATRDLGLETKSFNFGVQAVQLLEQRRLLQAILEARPGLKRLFFEYQWLAPQIDPDNAFSPRTVYWHDLETTQLALERTAHWGRELGDEFRFVESDSERRSVFTVLERALAPATRVSEQHLQHYLTELLMIGRGKDVLRGLAGRSSGQAVRYRDRDGYIPLEEDERILAAQGEVHNSYRARRERFLAELDVYHHDVDTLDAAEVAFGDAAWVNADLTRVDDFELIASIAAEVRARGVEFVLVILPSQSCNRPFEARLLSELGAVLRYNLPDDHPALYEPRNRWDSGHLSEEGALYFSRLLARDLAGLQRSAGERAGEHSGGPPQ